MSTQGLVHFLFIQNLTNKYNHSFVSATSISLTLHGLYMSVENTFIFLARPQMGPESQQIDQSDGSISLSGC